MDVLGSGGIRGSFRKLRQSQAQTSGGEEGEKAEQVGESCQEERGAVQSSDNCGNLS